MTITKIRYDGKAASLSEQLALLKQHGVLIPDEKTAGHYLSFVGYYRFFAYVKPFLSNSLPSSIAFDHIWNLYTFDQKLIFRYTPKDVPCAKHQEHRFYQQVVVLKEMLAAISPHSGWLERLKSLMAEYRHLPLERMGFLKDWLRDPLWDTNTKDIVLVESTLRSSIELV